MISGPQCYSPLGILLNVFATQKLSPECRELLSTPMGALEMVSFFEYLKVFLLTVLLECPFYLYALKAANVKKNISAQFALNLSTHPFVYFAFPWIAGQFSMSYFSMICMAEVFAPAVECLLLVFVYKLSWKKAGAFALLANLFSWWVGVFLTSR